MTEFVWWSSILIRTRNNVLRTPNQNRPYWPRMRTHAWFWSPCGMSSYENMTVYTYVQCKVNNLTRHTDHTFPLHFSPLLLFVRFVHPRFGPIKCIRTIRAVQKDEELTVAYGYDHGPSGKSSPEAPDWYKQELREFQEREAERRAKDS